MSALRFSAARASAGLPGRLRLWVGDDTPLKRLLTARSWTIQAYFEARYLIPDPWHLATSPYERERAERSLALLGRRYATALDLGCGEGTLTARLLDRCDHVVAADFSALALRRARRRFAGDPRVEVRRLDVLREGPGGTFELVFCGELFYYMSRAQFEEVAPRVARWVAPGGDLCLVHGISAHDAEGTDTETARLSSPGRTGAREIHDHFCQMPDLVALRDLTLPRYRLTLLRRREGAHA